MWWGRYMDCTVAGDSESQEAHCSQLCTPTATFMEPVEKRNKYLSSFPLSLNTAPPPATVCFCTISPIFPCLAESLRMVSPTWWCGRKVKAA